MIGGGEVECRQGPRIFLFTTASRRALGPTQLPIQWVPGALSLVVKLPGSEADLSSPSSAEFKKCVELYLHSSNMPSWRDAQLKHRDYFTLLYFTLLYFTATGNYPVIIFWCDLLANPCYSFSNYAFLF
jgi:hypothetical protein